MKKLNLLGQTFGRWTVIGEEGKTFRGQSRWKCLCSCGTVKVIQGTSLRSGDSQSCGCRKLEPNLANASHGMSSTKVYRAWVAMKARCEDPGHQAWANYGGRGITVCSRWRDFSLFLADMGEPEAHLTLERKNNSLGYSPENCCWATRSEQAKNTRRPTITKGKTQEQLAKELGISVKTVRLRQRHGKL